MRMNSKGNEEILFPYFREEIIHFDYPEDFKK